MASDSEPNIIIKLSVESCKKLSSSQVITSVSSVVKELVENALDAGSHSITVKLDNFGLEAIEVKDNGHGISAENVAKMCLPGYTSKIAHFSDLEHIKTYGFRGEALNSLCKMAHISVTTKTAKDQIAMTYSFNSDGILQQCSKPSHLSTGTCVYVKNLFYSLPVRKQYYLSSKKRLSDELKNTLATLETLAVIHPELRVICVHNNNLIWQKNKVSQLKQSFMQCSLVGLKKISLMDVISVKHSLYPMELIIPKKNVIEFDQLTPSGGCFIYVNNRPLSSCKEITKLISKRINKHFTGESSETPSYLFLISISVAADEIDINVEPDKSRIFFKNFDSIKAVIDDELTQFYGGENDTSVLNDDIVRPTCKKVKLVDDNDVPLFSPSPSSSLLEPNLFKDHLDTPTPTLPTTTATIATKTLPMTAAAAATTTTTTTTVQNSNQDTVCNNINNIKQENNSEQVTHTDTVSQLPTLMLKQPLPSLSSKINKASTRENNVRGIAPSATAPDGLTISQLLTENPQIVVNREDIQTPTVLPLTVNVRQKPKKHLPIIETTTISRPLRKETLLPVTLDNIAALTKNTLQNGFIPKVRCKLLGLLDTSCMSHFRIGLVRNGETIAAVKVENQREFELRENEFQMSHQYVEIHRGSFL